MTVSVPVGLPVVPGARVPPALTVTFDTVPVPDNSLRTVMPPGRVPPELTVTPLDVLMLPVTDRLPPLIVVAPV